MSTAVPVSEKQMAMEAIRLLPDTATLAEIGGELALLAARRRGDAADAGQAVAAEEDARRLEGARRLLAVLLDGISAPETPEERAAADKFFENMNANRAAVGGAIPYPPELKGKTW